MTQFLSWIKSKLTLDETFQFHGTAEDIAFNLDDLKNNKWRNGFFYSYFIEPGHYEIRATISVGTIHFMGFFGGIKLNLIHTPAEDYQQQVHIFTKIRHDTWVFLAVSLFIIFASIVAWEGWLQFIMMLCLSVIVFLWFSFVIRVQQNILMDKITKRLRLKDR